MAGWRTSTGPTDIALLATGPRQTVWVAFCICTETTEKILAEQRLQAQVERQRRLFEQAPGFIAILRRPKHVFEFVNLAFRHLAGDREYIGRTVRDVFPDVQGQGS
jgi:PAS domain-containing protein